MGIKNYLLHMYTLLPHCIRMFIGIKKRVVGKDNRIEIRARHCRKVRIDVLGNNNSVIIEEGCILRDLKISIIGNNCILHLSRNVELYGGGELNLEDNNARIVVGENSRFTWGDHKFNAVENNSEITIGKNCLFSFSVHIDTSDHHGIYDMETGARVNKAKSVCIGDNVWIAPYVTILKGSVIKDGSVVGTHSVVTKAFDESNVVIAGNPAKIVKNNIFWKKELE